MPQPPNELRSLLEDIILKASEESSAAVERHKEILSRLLAQEEVLERQLSDVPEPNTSKNPTTSEIVLTEDVGEAPTSTLLAIGRAGALGRVVPKVTFQKQAENLQSQVALQNQAKDKGAEEGSKEQSLGTALSAKSELAFGVKEATHDASLISWVKDWVSHDRFEISIAGLIIANAFVMCWEVQRAGLQIGCQLDAGGCGNDWPGALDAFEALDYCFGIVFTLEAVLKVVVFHWRYFLDKWNFFDIVCVLVFLVDKVAAAIFLVDSQAMRMLRLFRLVRLVKLLGALESLNALYLMSTALQGMTLVVLWAVALLVVMLTTCALFLTQYLHSSYFDDMSREALSQSALETHQKMYEYFGTTSRCFLTMFELTLANWAPAVRLLTEEISEWFTPICLTFKLTIGFAVVGVINGVILQETFRVAATDDFIMVRQTKRAQLALRQKMQVLFAALDRSEDGEVDFNEFQIISCHPDVMHWLSSMDIETSDLRTLFDLVDIDGNGSISLEELVTQMPRIRGTARNFDLLAMRQELRHLKGE